MAWFQEGAVYRLLRVTHYSAKNVGNQEALASETLRKHFRVRDVVELQFSPYTASQGGCQSTLAKIIVPNADRFS